MGTVGTSTAAQATAFGAQRKQDRTSNGVLWEVFWDGTASTTTGLSTCYSTDQGATWATAGSIGFAGTGTVNAVPGASLFIDLDDFAHLVYEDRFSGAVHYRRGTPNAARTAYTWTAPVTSLGNNGNSAAEKPDVVAHREGTGWAVHVVMTYTGNQNIVWYDRLTISSTGVISAPAGQLISAGSGELPWPSIDFHHTGDGKTVKGGTPHLFVGFSAGTTGGVRFRRAEYSGGAWTWATELQVDATRYVLSQVTPLVTWLTCHWDGTRVMIAGHLQSTTANTQHTMLYERSTGGDTFTTRQLATAAAGAGHQSGTATYDAVTGDVFLFGRDTGGANGTRSLRYTRWRRSTLTADPDVVLDTTTSDTPYVSARRGSAGFRVDYTYTDGTTSPWSVISGQVVLNTAPTAAIRTAPADNAKIDRALPLTLDWDFTDPDTGDTQSAADVRYRPIGATTYTTAMVTTATAYVIPAGTLAPGDYEWAVRTYDAQGAVSPWSSTGYFTAANAPAAPTITAPPAGATVPERVDLTWSAPTQDAYQVQRLLASNGSVLFDTGRVADPTARARTLTFPTNNQGETLRVRVEVGGLWSAWSSVAVQVAYTPPATPVVTLTAVETIPGAGPDALRITITNPPPGAGQPPVVSHDVLIDHGDSDGLARRATGLPAGQPFTYHLPVSGRDYSGGRVQVVAVAGNGTTSVGSS